MKRIAYLDIIGGISGDMFISAMLDAGLQTSVLQHELAKIVPDEFQIDTATTSRGAIKATHVDIVLTGESARKMDWRDFDALIQRSDLPSEDLVQISSIFDCLKQAESNAHAQPVAATHLHELGTLDTMIDIAGAVIGLRLLGVSALYASPIPASIGMSSSSHGKGASFAPATMSIIRNSQLSIKVSGPNQPVGESVTPTGAAIVATLASFKPAKMHIASIGYGAGTRDTDTPPNVLGLWLGDTDLDVSPLEETANTIGVDAQSDTVLIETNLDDMTGEELGYAMQQLMGGGALDAWMTPIQMKKSRTGVVLSAICKRSELDAVSAAFFKHTTTLGVRVRPLERLVAEREIVIVDTGYGPIPVKLRRVGGKVTQTAPEYDDCAKLASEHGVPVSRIMNAAKLAAIQLEAHRGD